MTLHSYASAIDAALPGLPIAVTKPRPEVAGIKPVAMKELVAAASSILRARRLREAMLPDLFADPAWDILLFLFASGHSRRPITVSDACVAAAVPTTTALRFITTLEKRGLVLRSADQEDRRRRFLKLSPDAETRVMEWLLLSSAVRMAQL